MHPNIPELRYLDLFNNKATHAMTDEDNGSLTCRFSVYQNISLLVMLRAHIAVFSKQRGIGNVSQQSLSKIMYVDHASLSISKVCIVPIAVNANVSEPWLRWKPLFRPVMSWIIREAPCLARSPTETMNLCDTNTSVSPKPNNNFHLASLFSAATKLWQLFYCGNCKTIFLPD